MTEKRKKPARLNQRLWLARSRPQRAGDNSLRVANYQLFADRFLTFFKALNSIVTTPSFGNEVHASGNRQLIRAAFRSNKDPADDKNDASHS
jgi:hypothetical protein